MEITKRKILLVDDNLELAEMMGLFLEHYGFQVSKVPNGRKAVERLVKESPDLVLLDLNLPDMPGGRVLKKIKEINDDTAVIIITAYGGEQVAVELMKAGAEDFISKPFENEVLLNSVKAVLKIRDARIEDKKHERLSSLEKFFPFLAHEIRNPLHAISGALAIIQRRSNLQDEVMAKSVKIIQEEVQHLSGFVQECLDFVRPVAKSRFVKVDVKEVVAVTINILSHIFEDLSKQIHIRQEAEHGIPKIFINYEEIKQAFLNILKNSFEAMGEGGELVIQMRFKAEPAPGWAEIVFRDNGSGIKKENLKSLFQPFFTTKLRGTGLGLAICRRIIAERHNGTIEIESEEGKGTAIRVGLPIAQTAEIPGEHSQ